MSKSRLESIEQQLKTLPKSPGVYLIYDDEDKVIYVGKAKNLVNRLRSHFAPSNDFSKSRVIREQGSKIEIHEVQSENEALLLEYNMIQEHMPVLNERWKDGKTYPYLEITTGEMFPRFVFTRERNNDKSIYLGPFSNLVAVKRSLKYVFKMFPVADCAKEIHLGDSDTWAHTCIRRRTRQCLRPCEVEVDQKGYRESVDQVINFVEGKLPEIVDQLDKKMQDSAKEHNFEQAAKYRDTIRSIQRTMERQSVMIEGVEDCIIIADTWTKLEACIGLQIVENERIVRQEVRSVHLKELKESSWDDFVINFLITILNLRDTEDSTERKKPIFVKTRKPKTIIKQLESFGFQADIPKNDVQQHLVSMVKKHTKRYLLRQSLLKRERGLPTNRVIDLQEMLDLEIPPIVIDAFDVSTLLGTNTVASCVRFENGSPLKKGYRQFKIRTVDGQDDFASMEEVVYRRYKGVEEGKDPKGLRIPDLILIDGGSEQLKRAKISLDALNLEIPVFGLAKKEEEVYFVEHTEPLLEKKDRPGLLLLRAARDESHRFAVKYQKKLRERKGLESILDSIRGIGVKRKKKLLQKYKTVSNIAKESSETLSEKIGISRELASEVIDRSRKFTTNQKLNEISRRPGRNDKEI